MMVAVLTATVKSDHPDTGLNIRHNNKSDFNYCEDIEKMDEKLRNAKHEFNPLKADRKCINRADIKVSPAATLPIKNDPAKCNFWMLEKEKPL